MATATKGSRRSANVRKGKVDGRILVTGATGFLGRHLIEALRGADELLGTKAEAGREVRALARRSTLHLEQHGVEVVLGDVASPEACADAVEGVSEIYHAAGFVSRDPARAGELYRVHVQGTRALLTAAARAKVRRVVVVSTSGTVAVSADENEISNEASPYRTTTVSRWAYYLSKIYQEQTALELGRELGLEVVIVSPSLLLGPGDDRGSSTGDIEKAVLGKLPVIPKGGGVAFVDARDAAAGCVLAMKRGRAGERYLLSAENMALDSFLGRAARLAGVAAPRALVSPRAMRAAGRVIESLWRRFEAEPPVDEQSLDMAMHYWYADASKAASELGWQHRDPATTLLDTVRDIQRRHNLTSSAMAV